MNCFHSPVKKIFFINLLGIRRKQVSFVPTFTNVARYETPARERVVFASYSTNLYYYSKRSGMAE